MPRVGPLAVLLAALVAAVGPTPLSAGPYLYATRPTTGSVVAIDLATGIPVAELPAGALPSGAAIDAIGQRLFVADSAAGTVEVFDTAAGHLATIAVGAGAAGVCAAPDGSGVFVAAAQADEVAALDPQSLAVVGMVAVADAPVALGCDAQRIVVASFGAHSVAILDAGSLALLSTVPVGAFPSGVAIAGGRAFVADLGDDTVSVVDLATQAVVATVPVGDAPRAIVAGGGRVFVANLNDGSVTVFDATSLAILATIPLPAGGPTDLALSPGGEALYVAHLAETSLTVVDTAALAVQGSLAAGDGLLALAGVAERVPAGGGVPAIPTLGGPGLLALALLLATVAWLQLRRRRSGRRGTVVPLALCLVSLASAPAARAGTVTFSDVVFARTDWTVFSAEVGNGSQEAMQVTMAGNPAPCRQMLHSSPPSSGPEEVVEVVHIFLGGSYDPATQGAIVSLDVAWDRIVADVDGGDGLVEEAFAVEQGGTAYVSSSETFSAAVWTTVSRAGLTANDLADENGTHPDFSAGGAPLSVGYLRRTRNAAAGSEFINHQIDNWSVTVENSAGAAGVVGFASPAFAVTGADAASIGVVRSGDPAGAAAVEVVVFPLAGAPAVRTASWADGQAGLTTVEFQPVEIGATEDLVILELVLEDPTPGITLDPVRSRAQLIASENPVLVQLALALQVLLASFGGVAVAVVAAFALCLAARRRRADRTLRGTALGAALLIATVASPGCVPTAEIQLRFEAARFNDRLRSDLDPLTPADLATDLRYGVFRDGSDGGLLNDIYPVAASDPGGPGNLVLTDCLFVGSQGGSRDSLRLSWEVVARIDRGVEPLGTIFRDGYDEVGLCTLSSPVSRLLGEVPGEPVRHGVAEGDGCRPGNAQALTLPREPERIRNILITCRFWRSLFARLEEHSTRAPDDPDALCPADHFDGTATTLMAGADRFACVGEDDLVDACAGPCGVEPVADVSYRVRVAHEEMGIAEDPTDGDKRWLKPNVLLVQGSRPLVRPLTRDGQTLRFTWQTTVEPPNGEEPVRWGENFSPTVRVDSVEILTRDANGSERVVAPASDRLSIRIPAPGVPTPATATCTGKEHDGTHLSFWIHPLDNQPSDCTFEPQQLRILTPTYAVSHLHVDPGVARPITWEVTLKPEDLAAGEQAFIRFLLRVETAPAAVRISPAALDFGELPEGDWRQGEVELENVGGEMIEVRSIGWAPGSAHPADFELYAVGDPVPMPLPVESQLGTDGIVALRAAAGEEAPILLVEEAATEIRITLGDPDRAGEPQAMTLYREGATLVGSMLLRHDPGAVFEPSAPENPRPFVLPAYAEARPPFVLSPGERITIMVLARPSALGVRSAALAVDAASLVNPALTQTVVAQLVVEALSGPQLHVLPPTLWIKRDHASQSPETRRFALLENVGHFDLEVQQLALAGAGAPRFWVESEPGLPPFVLRPGEASDLVIHYLPECDGAYALPDHEAQLLVESDGGAAAIPLFGMSQGFCELP